MRRKSRQISRVSILPFCPKCDGKLEKTKSGLLCKKGCYEREYDLHNALEKEQNKGKE
jgi:hypothetical protein